MGCQPCQQRATPSYGTVATPRVIDQRKIDAEAQARMPKRPVRRVQVEPGQFSRGR